MGYHSGGQGLGLAGQLPWRPRGGWSRGLWAVEALARPRCGHVGAVPSASKVTNDMSVKCHPVSSWHVGALG